MKHFLYSVAETFYNREGENISNYAFVFPNRRAGIFFGKYLGDIAGKPIFSPHIFTISDFILSLSKYQLIDRTETLFALFKHYKRFSKSTESFDDFVYWGDMLINDFDDVDKYMADASALFSNINDLKEIDKRFGTPLTQEQISFIKRFCDNFDTEEISGKRRDFISLWSILYDVYSSLRKDLSERGLGYEGMIFRDVAEHVSANEVPLPYRQVVFVGFNLLTKAEEEIMKALKLSGKADFYWDNNAPTLRDGYNKANYFIGDNIKKFPSRYLIKEEPVTTYPTIEVIGVPSGVGQAKYAGGILSEISPYINLSSINTAVVLPDELLLMPMLYSVPESIDSINVTMGYPLGETSLAGFMSTLFDLQKGLRTTQSGKYSFYHRNVRLLLGHVFVKKLHGSVASDLDEDIRVKNKVYVDISDIPEQLRYLFCPLKCIQDAYNYLKEIISKLSAEKGEQSVSPIEREFLYSYELLLNRLFSLSDGEDISVSVFFKLLKRITAGIKVPFTGEPLSGLQIMGVLETRALDFDNIIVLSMNEGVFPADGRKDTFIPYGLRRGFGLSLSEHTDSISAYYFYRMISRAKRVFLIYDTRSEGMRTGEVSRFVRQLKYQYLSQTPNRLIERSICHSIKSEKGIEIEIDKRGTVASKLNEFLSEGKSALSASALNEYIDCPLKFYFDYVEKIKDDDEVLEDIEASALGSIYHGVMQDLYSRFIGKVLTIDTINELIKDNDKITSLIETRFAEEYFKSAAPKSLTGRLFLRGEIVRKMVKRTLEIDKQRAPFTMMAAELRVNSSLPLADGRRVNIKGFIDRVDKKGGEINIIDYKSGKAELTFKSIESLFDGMSKSRNKAVLQLFFYLLMYKDNVSLPITPGIYSWLRFFDKQGFSWNIYCDGVLCNGDNINQGQNNLLSDFTERLCSCITDIFNFDLPFTQTKNSDICRYCNFTALCRR